MGNLIRSYKMYPVWEYEDEERDLNEASKKGIQLVKGGCFHSVFKKDDSVSYYYQLDYNLGIKDVERYRESFEEQGWEYINSTFNGWHYFRKKKEEMQSEDDQHIYTDRESLFEMQNRWIRLLKGLEIFYVVFTILYTFISFREPGPAIILETCIFGTFAIMFGLALINISRGRQGKRKWPNLPIQVIFPVSIILLLIIPFLL